MKIRLAIASDHRGFALKQLLFAIEAFQDIRVIWHDCGTSSEERCDYPLFAFAACDLLINKQVDGAVLLCGSGIGMSIAANRLSNVFAGLVWCPAVARSAKEDDNCSVISIPADYCDIITTQIIMYEWLNAKFKGGRYQKRLEMIDKRASGDY